ncbi:MAG: HepT-like ribonuclease domain-containing protein [Chthoniobacterales bacterium]
MSDLSLLRERLEAILEALERVPGRFAKAVIGMRNVLAHDYFGINEEVLF